ncbi:MAG: hypothetical protein VX527_05820 [Planctomycetota bacterium]|nr:hypothetical protein [Planctomycetota bacterium]
MYLQILYSAASFLTLATALVLVIWVVRRPPGLVIMVAIFESLIMGFVSLSLMGGIWFGNLIFGPDPVISLTLWLSQLLFLIWALQQVVKRAWNGELKDIFSALTKKDLLLINKSKARHQASMNARRQKKERAAQMEQDQVAGNEAPISSGVD